MSQPITGIRIIRQFEKHKVRIVKRRNRYFGGIERYKRLLMILMGEDRFSRLEVGAGLLPYYTDPRTGMLTQKGKRALDNTIRTLNQNGYKEKFPLAKIYSLPFVDENSVDERGIATARYLLVLVYGKSIKEVVAAMEKVIAGINRSIDLLHELKSINVRKVVRELQKYKQQIEFDVQIARRNRRTRPGVESN
jgi:hypothetical protein